MLLFSVYRKSISGLDSIPEDLRSAIAVLAESRKNNAKSIAHSIIREAEGQAANQVCLDMPACVAIPVIKLVKAAGLEVYVTVLGIRSSDLNKVHGFIKV